MSGLLPIYVTRDPKEYAAEFKERLLALGVSEEYAEKARKGTIARAVRVASSWQGNMIASGKQQAAS